MLEEKEEFKREELLEENTPQENTEVAKKKENKFVLFWKKFFSTLWRWTRRMFMGASKDLQRDEGLRAMSEQLESPGRIAAKKFFKKKVAVGALIVIVSLFAFVFIAPLIVEIDYKYNDQTQSNLAPTMALRKVPKGLRDNIRSIDGTSSFTVGVSKDNEFFIWGITKDQGSGIELKNIPDSIKDNNVLFAAAGVDHVVAITTDGEFIGWGNNTQGQYGMDADPESVLSYYPMNDIFKTKLDVSKITDLYAGNKFTACIYDGKLYTWGNYYALQNMEQLDYEMYGADAVKASFGNYYGIVLTSDGKMKGYNSSSPFDGILSIPGSKKYKKVDDINEYIFDKTIVDIGSTDNVFYFVTSEGVLGSFGVEKYDEKKLPLIPADEKFTSIVGGGQHAVAMTDAGKAYGFGLNSSKQANFTAKETYKVFTGNKQTYFVDSAGKLTKAYGLQGYPMGTDRLGRDVFTRIIHGGKMTMTIGAVAVIISTIIAIIVGSLSGYFGKWVDMLLMRVTEIVGAIPFLPFAMLLSHVLTYTQVTETMRIFIIMMILGVLSWTGLAHMIRGQVLAEREKDFVLAAKAMGVKERRIAFKHILPNVVSIIFVSVTLDFAGCLLTESSLSYLGFGVQEPRATWGNMLNAANNDIVISTYWWQWVFPAAFLAIATISINIIGDALRDALDPRGTGER